MAKGRPPLAPRIEALEAQVKNLREAAESLLQANDALGKIVQILQNTVSRGTDGTLMVKEQDKTVGYKPLFDRWPGN